MRMNNSSLAQLEIVETIREIDDSKEKTRRHRIVNVGLSGEGDLWRSGKAQGIMISTKSLQTVTS